MAKCTGAVEQIPVHSNIDNVTIGVPPFGNVTFKWSFGHQFFKRVVLAMSNASNVIARLKNGDFRCYNGELLTQTECQEHFLITVNASSDLIIAMTNLSDPYFGRFLISVYRGMDSKIDTVWITVYKKELLQRDTNTTELTPTVLHTSVSYTHTEGYIITEETRLRDLLPMSNGTVKTNIAQPTVADIRKEKALQSGWRIPVLAISASLLAWLVIIGVSYCKRA